MKIAIELFQTGRQPCARIQRSTHTYAMKSARCYSSIFALLLVMILLFAAHAQAQTGPIANLINSRQGIAYNANARTVSSNYTVQAEDHTVLVNAASAAVTVTLPAASQKRYP